MSLLALSCPTQPALIEHHVLGMAEMGYRGLSEQWLLRRAGDLHWRLIARAMGQKEAVFTCSAGEPLYAAFCASSLFFSRPELPRLGGEIALSAHLHRVGNGRLASYQRIVADGEEIGRLILISTFVGRTDPDCNRSIVRRAPKVLAMPSEAPLAVQRVARRAADMARQVARDGHLLVKTSFDQKILPCPSTDFNAVGLLYFPSFSALAERALFEAGATAMGPVVSRHVAYLGNVEPGEWISVRFRNLAGGHEAVLRGVDDRPLALMRVRFKPPQAFDSRL